jgi:hypothetical protein
MFSRNVKRLQNLEIGMTKNQVVQVMGDPDSARGARQEDNGKTTEVWTYVLKRPGCGRARMYLLRFENEKLARWGLEQDWLRQPDKVEKIIRERESQQNKTALY